jgi:hypothetical protein
MASMENQDIEGMQQDASSAENAALVDTLPLNLQLIHDEDPTSQQHLLDRVQSASDGERFDGDSEVSI